MSPTQPFDEAPGGLDFLTGGGGMGALMRSTDWSRTPLGPIAAWPQSLRSALSICLNSRFPIALYWGPELALLYNDAWSSIPGDKHPWALGRPGHEVWPEIWDTIGPLYAQVRATGEGVWLEDRLLPMHRHGYTEECYFNFTFSPIRGENGGVEGIFNAVVETTFRVLEERRVRALRELGERTAAARSAEQACVLAAAALAGAAADMPFCLLYLLDEDGRVRLAAAAGLSPGGPASPAGFGVADAAAPWPLAAVLNSGRVEVVTGLGARFGAPLPGGDWPEPADGAFIAPIAGLQAHRPAGFLVAGKSPRRAVDGAYLAFVGHAAAQIATAVANARAHQEERRRAEALAELDRAKTAFFANVSHEFRTPLTLLLGPLEDALAADALPAAQRGPLEVARRNARRLEKLVNTLLDFARLKAGRAEACFEPTDLAALTAELAGVFRAAVERAGLKLVVDCPPLAEPVFVDRAMWEKVVFNLLSNAFKFTFAGEIAVRLRPAGERVELCVRDTGTGIPATELPRLFERFHRVQGARGRSLEGSGIGLALVQELVKLHGGTIGVESAVDRGSAFTVSLPRGSAHLPAGRIGAPRPSAPAGLRGEAYFAEAAQALPDAGSPPARTPDTTVPEATAPETTVQGARAAQRARLLVADDNADLREYLRRLLSPQYQVTSVADGEAALAAAREEPFDLVLTDVMMPGLDGFGLLAALRADERMRTLPVILLSARAGEEARIEGMQAGADDYLVQPFPARELLARVGARLEIARLRREAEAATRESEERLRKIFEYSNDAIFVLDPARDRVRAANPKACAMFGYGPEEILATPVSHFHPKDLGRFQTFVQGVVEEGHGWTDEFACRTKDGRFITSEISASTVTLDGAACILAILRDVTARKEAEARLRASEAQNRLIFESAKDYAIFTTDLKRRVNSWNPGAETIFGYAEAEIMGESADRLFVPEDRAAGAPELEARKARDAGRAENERWHLRRDGSRFYGSGVTMPLRDDAGATIGFLNIMRDLTERQRAEDALRDAQTRLEATLDAGEIATWTWDIARDRVHADRNLARLFSVSEEQARGGRIEHYLRALHPEDRERVAATIAQAVAAGDAYEAEYRLVQWDGSVRWVIARGRVERDASGMAVGLPGVLVDLTERKQAEEALRLSEEKYRTVFESIDEGFCVAEVLLDAQGRPCDYRFLEANPTFGRLTGLEQPVGRTALELVPGLEPFWVETYGRVALTGEAVRFESRAAPMDGRWFDVHAARIGGEGSRRIAIVFSNITARKAAEAALRESEGRFRSMADAAPAMFWVTEADGTCSFLSRGWFEFTGQTEDQALGFGWLQAVHPEDRERARAEFLAAHAARRPFAIEHRLCRTDGSYGWVIDAGRPRHSPATEVRPGASPPGESRADGSRTGGSGPGEFLGYVGNVFDIGERKRAEDRLRFLAALADATQPLADPDAITATAARLLGEHLRADRCAYAEVDADEDHFAVTGDHCRGVASIVGRYRMADFGTEVLSAMRANRPYVVADVDTDPQAGPDLVAYRQTQIRAVVCVPLHKDGRFVAAFAAHQSAPRAWTAEEVDLVQLVADRVWESIERARVARHLRDSEAQFRQLAETIPNLAWMANPDGHIVWYNRRWYEYTGTTPAEMAGWGWQRVHDPNILPRVLERWRTSLGSGAPFDMVFPLRGRDGVFRPFLTLVNPLRGPDGAIQFWFGTNTDVSAQKRAEDTAQFLADVSAALAELVDPRDTLRQIATLAVPRFADGCTVDLLTEDANAATGPGEAGAGNGGGRLERLAVVHADPDRARQAQELFDRHPPRLTNARGVGRVLASGEADWGENVDDAVLRAVAEDAGHLRLLRALGLRSYLCVPLRLRGRMLGAITFVTAESGRRYGLDDLRVAEDLARRITVALENVRLYQALQEADRRKDEFLATLAHELRNPLAPVRTGLEVLKLAPPGPVADAVRAMMERQLGHMVRLVDDLLDVSRVSRGKLELKKTRVTLQVVLDAALETSRPVLEAGRHALRVSIPSEPVWLDADLTRLAQVVGNLLANAAKYTPDGGHVALDARREGNEALVSVSDDGLGIPPEMLERVFEMFAQVNRTLDRAQGGLGIGLALVRRLVDMHGGTITAASPGPGRGSTFTLRLPLAGAVEVSARPPVGDAAAPGGLRVLVVDDNRDAAESLSLMLELGGHDVRSAHDGPAALEVVRGFVPEVVFLDIGMPGMDGYAVARRLRVDPSLAGAVLVALTGWGSEEDKRRAGEAGFDHHLTKPVAAWEVIEVLARLGPARRDGE